MSKEKYIRGKRDDAHHDGLASNIRREQESLSQLQDSEDIKDAMRGLPSQKDKNFPRHDGVDSRTGTFTV